MKIVKGNLITLAESNQFDYIIHGCNCFHKMESGITKQLAVKYKEVREADLRTKLGDKGKLGRISITPKLEPGFSIINAYTQFRYKGNGQQVSYEAVRKCFKYIKMIFGGKNLRFGYPKIGSGVGEGGDWNIISEIIDEELTGEDHTLVELVNK